MISHLLRLALLLAAVPMCFGQTSYTATPITPPAGYRFGALMWISDDGKTGFGGASQDPSFTLSCMTYQNGVMSLLPTPGLPCNGVGANTGKYIATLGTDSSGRPAVTSITSGSNTVLTPPSGTYFPDIVSVGVSSSGQMATTLSCAPPTGVRNLSPCAYTISSSGTFTRLPDLGYGAGALAINAAGDVAGWVELIPNEAILISETNRHAVVWLHTGRMIDLTAFSPISSSQPNWSAAINSKGQVVARSGVGTSFFFDGVDKVTLIEVPNATWVGVTSINDSGEVVGSYMSQVNDGLAHPFYYWDGKTLDLNSAVTNLGSGPVLTSPNYINAAGQILSTVALTTTPSTGAITNVSVQSLLTPIRPAALIANPTSLSFTAETIGAPPASQNVQVTASGSSPVSFTAAVAGGTSWLSIIQSGSTTPASLTVSVAPAGLEVGVHNAQIVLTSSGGGPAQTVIPVTLTVVASQPMTASPSSLIIPWRLGDGLPTQAIQIAATGSSPLNFTAQMSAILGLTADNNCPALSVTPSRGVTPATLTLSVTDAAARYAVPGTNSTVTCYVIVTADNPAKTQISIAALLSITAPAISVSPTSLNFSYQIGAAVPENQSIQLSSPNSAAAGFSVALDVSNVPNWVSFTPARGTTPAALSVAVSPTGLAAGVYTADLIINGIHVPVVLTVTGNAAAPTPVITSVVNAASFAPGTSSDTWITIQGSNLASTSRAWKDSDFNGASLPTSLDGVSVMVNGQASYPSYVSPTQINVLAPRDSATGQVQVQVTNGPLTSKAYMATKSEPMPALFVIGSKYAAAVHADGRLVGATGMIPGSDAVPVTAGEIIQVYGTGFGSTLTAAPAGQLLAHAIALSAPVTVSIGGEPATVTYAGMASNGLDQLNVTIPSGLSNGDHEIVATVAGVSSQSKLYVTVKN
jgi:uncharacterized protein (TIGR03437 family)